MQSVISPTNLTKMANRSLNPKEFEEIKKVTLAEYNRIQIHHILKHKWYLSEELNKEISFNEACVDWIKSDLAKEFRKFFTILK
jgi:hypothetical protein